MEANLKNLRSCPFCRTHDDLSLRHEGVADEWWWRIYCDYCCTEGPTASTSDGAVAAWNGTINRRFEFIVILAHHLARYQIGLIGGQSDRGVEEEVERRWTEWVPWAENIVDEMFRIG